MRCATCRKTYERGRRNRVLSNKEYETLKTEEKRGRSQKQQYVKLKDPQAYRNKARRPEKRQVSRSPLKNEHEYHDTRQRLWIHKMARD